MVVMGYFLINPQSEYVVTILSCLFYCSLRCFVQFSSNSMHGSVSLVLRVKIYSLSPSLFLFSLFFSLFSLFSSLLLRFSIFLYFFSFIVKFCSTPVIARSPFYFLIEISICIHITIIIFFNLHNSYY